MPGCCEQVQRARCPEPHSAWLCFYSPQGQPLLYLDGGMPWRPAPCQFELLCCSWNQRTNSDRKHSCSAPSLEFYAFHWALVSVPKKSFHKVRLVSHNQCYLIIGWIETQWHIQIQVSRPNQTEKETGRGREEDKDMRLASCASPLQKTSSWSPPVT